jgi:starch-binding outer membrane protein, SusD/RagB family
MKINISQLFVTGFLTLAVINACTEKLDVLDVNTPTVESYFKTATELQGGVNAIYSSLRSASLAAREWFTLHDMRGSEAAPGGPQLEQPRAELLLQTNGAPSNFVLTSVWNGCYQMINRANLVLSKAPEVTDNTALRDVLVGEAKFLRAWAYFELASQWGDVPLYTEPVTTTTGYKGKSPSADIYALIIKDLNEAVSALPETPAQQGRATKGAANALLGRVQMQKGDYAAAKEALLMVYGKYKLVDDFLHNFDGDVKSGDQILAVGHEFNEESIFEVAFFDRGNNGFNWGLTGEGIAEAATTARHQDYGIVWGNVIPSDRLLAEFDINDPRYKYTFLEEGDKILTFAGTQPGYTLKAEDINVQPSIKDGVSKRRIFRKYSVSDWVREPIHMSGVNQRLIRYADVLLMLAECEIELGNLGKAADYINEVRDRKSVKMPHVTLTSKSQAIRAIMRERAVELAIENINNLDILRWRRKGYYPSIMPDPRPNQQEFLPIPASELAANPMLK